MKKILSILSLLTCFTVIYGQNNIEFCTPFNITGTSSLVSGNTYTVSGVIDDNYGGANAYTGSSIAIGDSLYFREDGITYAGAVTLITATSGNNATFRFLSTTALLSTSSSGAMSGQIAISRKNLQGYCSVPSGLNEDLRWALENRFKRILANDVIAAKDITRYVGNGVPLFTPLAGEPVKAIGLLDPFPEYNWNGTAWIPAGGVIAVGTDSLPPLYVKDFGIFPSNSAAVNSLRFARLLNDTIPARKGGKIVFGLGKYQFNQNWKIPFYLISGDNTLPQTYNIIIEGQGATASGLWQTTTTGTIVEFSATRGVGSDTLAFIDTRGAGRLKTEAITFVAATAGRAFIHTTKTTLDIQNCAFIGAANASGSESDLSNDAIILGDYTPSYANDTTYESSFQGYGAVIRNNFFNRVNTVCRFGTFANANFFENNNIWNQCGGSHCIVFYSQAPGQAIVGNSISNNLFESHYKTVIHLNSMAVSNNFVGNGFFDTDFGTTIMYLNEAQGNYIQHSFYDGKSPAIGRLGTELNNNTIIATAQSDTTRLNYGTVGLNRTIRDVGATDKWFGVDKSSYFTDQVFGSNQIAKQYTTGGVTHNVWSFAQSSPASKFLDFPSTGGQYQVGNSGGSLRLQSNTNEFWFSNNKFYSLGNGILYATQTNNSAYKMTSTGQLGWSGTVSVGGGEDVAFSRLSAGLVASVNGGGGVALRDFAARKIGINTPTPEYALDIDGNTGGSGKTLRVQGLTEGLPTDSIVLVRTGGAFYRGLLKDLIYNQPIISSNNIIATAAQTAFTFTVSGVDATIVNLSRFELRRNGIPQQLGVDYTIGAVTATTILITWINSGFPMTATDRLYVIIR